MSNATLPLQLEELFFPVQEVRTNPAHNPNGNRQGTQIDHALNVHVIDAAAGRYGIQMELSSSAESSENPPYFFHLQAYAIVVVDPQLDPVTAQSITQTNGQLILIGAVRERLLELTSRAPWGRFLLSTLPVVIAQPG